MMAQMRDEERARVLASRIAERSTRHERGTKEAAYLLSDLSGIAGDAEELVSLLPEVLRETGIREFRIEAASIATLRIDKIAGLPGPANPKPGPEIVLGSLGGVSLMDVMEEAVEAKERVADERAKRELVTAAFEAAFVSGPDRALAGLQRPYHCWPWRRIYQKITKFGRQS